MRWTALSVGTIILSVFKHVLAATYEHIERTPVVIDKEYLFAFANLSVCRKYFHVVGMVIIKYCDSVFRFAFAWGCQATSRAISSNILSPTGKERDRLTDRVIWHNTGSLSEWTVRTVGRSALLVARSSRIKQRVHLRRTSPSSTATRFAEAVSWNR